ncbi:MAG: hypothetical protein JNM83_09210 [Myxococcales bacterium]|jgi:hypothetical protein|nr:hypothetical protein [Myxococcales bacterium]
MSASRALPVKAPVKKTAVPRTPRSSGSGVSGDVDTRDMIELVQRPLPADPAQRADFFASIDKGIAEAKADQVIDWEDLDRQICKKYGLPSA